MCGCRSASSTRTTSSPTSSRRSKRLSQSEVDVRTSPSPRKRGEGARRRTTSRASADAELSLSWPIDLGLTVASHGWVHLEPWRWEPETGTLSHAERIGGRAGMIAVRQRDLTKLVVSWSGFPRRTEAEILRRAGRWVSAEWSPEAAVAALAPSFPEEAALVARGGGRLLRCSTFYEDFIKTLLTVNTSWSGTCRMVSALVAEPGGGAFPLPEMIMEHGEQRLRLIAKLGFRAPVAVLATERMLADGLINAEGNGVPT